MKKYSIYVLFVLLMLFNNNVNVINYQVERKNYSESLNNTFEDNNFYKCVIDSYNRNNSLSVSYDTKLSDEELSMVTSLNCNGKDKNETERINSVKGIEKLTNLNSLNLKYNNITDFDISNNTKLTKIFIEGNKINKLDTSYNKNLGTIYAMNNNISDINISNNNALASLVLTNNKITNINLAGSPYLSYIDLGNNNLSSIDLTNNTNLSMIYINNNKLDSIDVSRNIYLDTLQISSNNINYIDISNNTKLRYLYLGNNKLSNIKFGKNKQLNLLYLNDNDLVNLDISNLNSINSFEISGNNKLINLNTDNNLIKILKLDDLDSLEKLNANMFSLESISIMGNNNLSYITLGTNIKNINIENSKLDNIDLSKNTLLDSLIINNSELSSIDLSNNINLTKLSLENNKLSSIDLTNNNKLTYINLKDNNFSKNMEPLLINSLINVNELDEMVKLPSSITNLSSNITLSNNLNISNNVIRIINGGKASIDINKFKNEDDMDINYKLMYFIDTVKISSEKYDLKKDYLFVYNDSDEEIKNNITTDYANFEIVNNILYVKYNSQTLKTYPLIRINSNDLVIKDNEIVIDSNLKYSNFISKLNVINGSYKVFNDNIEITDGDVLSGMNLKIYYNDEEIFNYNIVSDVIDLSKLNIKNNKYIISSISKVSDLKSKLNSKYIITVTDKDNNILTDNDYLKTNSKISIKLSNTNYEYIIVVMGDVTGSGNIFIGDISKLYRYYKGLITLEEPYKIAGDVTYDGVIEINDIAKLYQYYKGIIKTLE